MKIFSDKIVKAATLFVFCFVMISCSGGKRIVDSNVVYVSIAPLANLVEQIADSSVSVEVLVPETTSPETYEPTTAQIQRLSNAMAYINTGLIDFESELNKSIKKLSDSLRILDLSQGIDVLAGSCSHVGHSHEGHSHGVDPHTWLSPRLMKDFAFKVKSLLDEIYPQYVNVHSERFRKLTERIDSLDNYIKSKSLENFAIAHPSLTYFAADYGVEQIAIEVEGKEPTISQMKVIIDKVRREGINKIFYQKQTSAAAAETIAREVGAKVIEFDPLAADWIANLYFFTDQISR